MNLLIPILIALVIGIIVIYGVDQFSPDPKLSNIAKLVVLIVFLAYVLKVLGLY